MSLSENYVLDYNQRTILSALYIILAVPIAIGNAWILLAILFSKRIRCSGTNWMVFFLCAGDFLVFFTRIPTTVIAFLHTGGWPSEIPPIFCRILAGVDVNNMLNSTCAILLLSFNRWVKVSKSPRTYHLLYNPWTITFTLSMVWTLKFLIAGLPPIVGFGSYGYNQNYETCSTDDEHQFNDYHAWIVVTFGFPMQIIFTIYFYVQTFTHIRRETAKGTKIYDSRVLAITRVYFCVAISIIILYLPYAVLYAIPGDLSYPYRNYGLVIMTFSSALNPILILTLHPDIKAVVVEMYRAATNHGHDMSNVVV